MRTAFQLFLIAALLALGETQSQAGLIIGTGSDISWNRATTPSGSPSITVPIKFDGVTTGTFPEDSLLSFTLGLKVVGTGGASGSLTFANVVNPSTNPIFASTSTPNPGVSSPFAGVTAIAVENGPTADVAPGLGGRNAVTFNFTSSDALGTFNIFADKDYSSFISLVYGFDKLFANASSSDLQIGQIIVTNDGGASVPEPTSLGLMVLAPVLGFLGWRSRRRAVRSSDEGQSE